MQPLEIQIRHQMGRYLTGEISLRDLRSWLAAHAWDTKPATPACDLVAEVELASAEVTGGHLEESDVRARLQPLVGVMRLSTMGATRGPLIYTSSAAETSSLRVGVATPFEFGCTRHVAVSA